MRLASFIISFCLHASFVLLVLFWPSPPLLKLDIQPMTVSLVDGLPGGNSMPSPILGPQGAPAQKQAPPLPSAPPKEPSPPMITEPSPEAVPVETPPPKLETPAPEPDTALLADKRPAPPKEPPKPTPPKEPPKPAPPKADPVKDALDKARAAAKATPGELKMKPNAVALALADARKRSGGQNGGGGGEGEGEGGGGIGDVYLAQIVMAVRPNWSWPALAKGNLSVALYLKMDATGRVLDVRVEESSGNAAFDSSAVGAVRVTQVLPPPPSPGYREIILSFSPPM
ncbi:MAG: cell envelope integrity protein TolA, partial [Betaproteobacteria bacterium]|nr:cell envelope integrity protein TolA [Betaproteobacteria bacterium]